MKPQSYGFTMIELLVTMVVAAILSAIAVPAFRGFLLNDRDTGQINSLVASLNYARSEAVKRSQNRVDVCPSVDGLNCVAAGTDWATGWIVKYVDPANALNDTVLQAVPALGGTNSVRTDAGNPGAITFSPSGQASGNVTVRVCDTRGAAFARQVEILTTGRIAASQQPGKSVAGAALACP